MYRNQKYCKYENVISKSNQVYTREKYVFPKISQNCFFDKMAKFVPTKSLQIGSTNDLEMTISLRKINS
jgi:hypothetical protein